MGKGSNEQTVAETRVHIPPEDMNSFYRWIRLASSLDAASLRTFHTNETGYVLK